MGPNRNEMYGSRGLTATRSSRSLPHLHARTWGEIARETAHYAAQDARVLGVIAGLLAITAPEIVARAAEAVLRAHVPPQQIEQRQIAKPPTLEEIINSLPPTIPTPNPEVGLSPFAQKLYKDTALWAFIDTLSENTSVTFKPTPKRARVQPENGIYFRNAPSEEADFTFPYGKGHQEEFAYDGEIYITKYGIDGIIHREVWAALDTSTIAYAFINAEDYYENGRIIPLSMRANLATHGPSSNDQPELTLRPRGDQTDSSVISTLKGSGEK